MGSCFYVEQGVGHFTGTADEELTVNFSAPYHTHPSITIIQSPQVGGVENISILDAGSGIGGAPVIVNQYSTTGAGINFKLEILSLTAGAINTWRISDIGSGYEIGDQILLAAAGGAKCEVSPAHEDYHLSFSITEVTKDYFKIKSSIEYTSVSFNWRAVGMKR